jgi:hypothetical protein
VWYLEVVAVGMCAVREKVRVDPATNVLASRDRYTTASGVNDDDDDDDE